jgi:DNA-binding transcriptional ArsR family regulator
MNMDYKTIRHHLEVLVKNGVITIAGDKYGAMYFISKAMEANLNEFNKIWEKIDKGNK